MKKVLMVSNNFHSFENIGSIRIRGLARYLPRFGWEPTVLTQGTDGANRDHVITIPPSRGQKAKIETDLSEAIRPSAEHDQKICHAGVQGHLLVS